MFLPENKSHQNSIQFTSNDVIYGPFILSPYNFVTDYVVFVCPKHKIDVILGKRSNYYVMCSGLLVLKSSIGLIYVSLEVYTNIHSYYINSCTHVGKQFSENLRTDMVNYYDFQGLIKSSSSNCSVS